MLADAGIIESGNHIFPVRVYFEDTDAAGVVYYANYLRYAERARTEMLRAIGVPHSGLMKEDGLVFVVHRCDVLYRRPAHLDDALEVHTGSMELTGTGLWADQVVRRAGEDLVRMRIRLACVGPEGKPVKLPVMLRRALEPFVAGSAITLKEKEGV
jgi:acyl-CoA thioester hydrolase